MATTTTITPCLRSRRTTTGTSLAYAINQHAQTQSWKVS
jgi:hypothetical protein